MPLVVRRRARVLTLTLLLTSLGLAHACAIATVRPMFQVSDELSYFAGAQAGALELGVATGPVVYDPGGKRAYQVIAGALLATLSRIAPPAATGVALRMLFALTVLVTVWATAAAARVACPTSRFVHVAAPLLVATQPVFVTYAAAVSPDALANAAGAVACLAAVRLSALGWRWLDVLTMLMALGAAVALKDTAYGLLPGAVVAIGAAWTSPRSDSPRRVIPVVASLLVGMLAIAVVSAFAGSRYWTDGTWTAVVALMQPDGLASLLHVVVRQAPSVLHSFWAHLGNFGGTRVYLPDGLFFFWAWLSVAAVAGLLLGGTRTSAGTAAVLVALVAGVALAAPLRLLVLSEVGHLRGQLIRLDQEIFQGRWLFPAMPAIAVLFSAGLSWTTRRAERWLGAFSWLALVTAVIALLGVVIPSYYVSFPDVVAIDRLYLLGTYGHEVDRAPLEPFIARPALLAGVLGWVPLAWFATLAVLALAGVATAGRASAAMGAADHR